jgi:hypothetical protein
MAAVDLCDFYPQCTHDEIVEILDIIAAERFAYRFYKKVNNNNVLHERVFALQQIHVFLLLQNMDNPFAKPECRSPPFQFEFLFKKFRLEA